jgi:hypothetical protein
MSFLLSYFSYNNQNISSTETNQSLSEMNSLETTTDKHINMENYIKDTADERGQEINCSEEKTNEKDCKSIENTGITESVGQNECDSSTFIKHTHLNVNNHSIDSNTIQVNERDKIDSIKINADSTWEMLDEYLSEKGDTLSVSEKGDSDFIFPCQYNTLKNWDTIDYYTQQTTVQKKICKSTADDESSFLSFNRVETKDQAVQSENDDKYIENDKGSFNKTTVKNTFRQPGERKQENINYKNTCPVVFVQDFFKEECIVEHYCKNLCADKNINFISTNINPLGSSYDRAVQLFHEIKGEICYFGRNKRYNQNVIDHTADIYGKYPQWDDSNPVIFLCVGYGGNTVRELIYLLVSQSIPKFQSTGARCVSLRNEKYYNTNQNWVNSVITISSPLAGVTKSKELNQSFLNNSFMQFVYFKYIGFANIVASKSNTLKKLFSIDRMQYLDLNLKDSFFLNLNTFNEKFSENNCFYELDTLNCVHQYFSRYSEVFSKTKVPVLQIVLNYDSFFYDQNQNQNQNDTFVQNCKWDELYYENKNIYNTVNTYIPDCKIDHDSMIAHNGISSCFSQKFFYGVNPQQRIVKKLSDFEADENEDCVYYVYEKLEHDDVTSFPTSDMTYYDKCFTIYNLCFSITQLFE